MKTEEGQAIVALRWTVGIVVLLESLHFTAAILSGLHLPKMGLPPWFWLALAISEAMAALLFLFEATRKMGAYALVVIFLVAGVVHVLHGEFDVGALVVYGVAVIASMGRQTRPNGVSA